MLNKSAPRISLAMIIGLSVLAACVISSAFVTRQAYHDRQSRTLRADVDELKALAKA